MTSNVRLTGAEGIRCAKCTRSPMNLRGPASGRYRPFGSCIHAPRGVAPCAGLPTSHNSMLRGACSTKVLRASRANRSLQEIAWGGKAKLARMSREQVRRTSTSRSGLPGWFVPRDDDPPGNGFPRVRRLCHNRCHIHGNGISCLMAETTMTMVPTEQARVFVHLLPKLIPPGSLRGGVAVVVDVLRNHRHGSGPCRRL